MIKLVDINLNRIVSGTLGESIKKYVDLSNEYKDVQTAIADIEDEHHNSKALPILHKELNRLERELLDLVNKKVQFQRQDNLEV